MSLVDVMDPNGETFAHQLFGSNLSEQNHLLRHHANQLALQLQIGGASSVFDFARPVPEHYQPVLGAVMSNKESHTIQTENSDEFCLYDMQMQMQMHMQKQENYQKQQQIYMDIQRQQQQQQHQQQLQLQRQQQQQQQYMYMKMRLQHQQQTNTNMQMPTHVLSNEPPAFCPNVPRNVNTALPDVRIVSNSSLEPPRGFSFVLPNMVTPLQSSLYSCMAANPSALQSTDIAYNLVNDALNRHPHLRSRVENPFQHCERIYEREFGVSTMPSSEIPRIHDVYSQKEGLSQISSRVKTADDAFKSAVSSPDRFIPICLEPAKEYQQLYFALYPETSKRLQTLLQQNKLVSSMLLTPADTIPLNEAPELQERRHMSSRKHLLFAKGFRPPLTIEMPHAKYALGNSCHACKMSHQYLVPCGNMMRMPSGRICRKTLLSLLSQKKILVTSPTHNNPIRTH